MSPICTIPTNVTSSTPDASHSSPHASSSTPYAGAAACIPCATGSDRPAARAAAGSEWKLPRREYARSNAGVNVSVWSRRTLMPAPA